MSSISERQPRCAYCQTPGDEATLEPFNRVGNLACRDVKCCEVRQAGMTPLLVNEATWSLPFGIPEGWVIANAPRPILGPMTWQGEFRHGVFYAAAPEVLAGPSGWRADDACLIVFISNEAIGKRIARKAADLGYADLAAMEDDGITVETMAGSMQLPWHQAAGK